MAEQENRPAGMASSERKKTLSPEAQRALVEAEERRRRAEAVALPEEVNGPQGPEPVRYGDWERKGIASDF
ncbi:DUF1674 domain-containing protein [Rhodoblastus acidophilus]|uniref:DUF1674 domain-containing protein n=1 Tax=Candidatus Rhodoblastus alkanivorans TaxID=2954117 RepID=A0ABS9Z1L8_9HYPH|nr:succinate dehydrogenase assembly factor 4 [Candidatus Rhodoblastus alkanivorans]MCI4678130.1 DUF1674 domain-containing protein [Candidatus Rhodoblastus alkanivorans]MCI4681529.1 DUF1674 domain-containing protein [Candidatus Rhodoblastus alkanivorans]MDI4642577.1 DUF1674 domain-containing protein [Rhodoblastus acidophilus]